MDEIYIYICDYGDHQLRLHAFAEGRLIRGHLFHHLLHLGGLNLGDDIRLHHLSIDMYMTVYDIDRQTNRQTDRQIDR